MNSTMAIRKLTSFASISVTKLKSIWNPLWKVLSFSPADDMIFPAKNVSISIEKDGLSVAYGFRFLSRYKIRGLKVYPSEGRYPSPESLASSVALAVNEFRASRTGVTLCIPKAWAIIKTEEFPSTIKENLLSAVSYELDRLTPFSPEDAYHDFKILEESAAKLRILIMAAKADLIRPYIEALREKGITVERITVNLSGICTLCRYIDRNGDFVFAEINEDEYEGALYSRGSIMSAFTGNFSENDERLKVDTIVTEIGSLMEEAQRENRSAKVAVLLKDKNPSLRELLKQQISHPIMILDETDIRLKTGLNLTEDVPYSAIGGVVESLWPKAKGLNLIKKGHHEVTKTPIAFTIVLSLLIIAIGIFYMVAPLRVEEKRLKEIDKQIAIRKEEVRRVEAIKKEIGALRKEILAIENFKGNRSMALNILKELTTILPKNAWLTRVRIAESTVDIEGYASSATTLLSKLEASKLFRKAEFASPTFRDARMNADRFIIKMEIEGVKKDEEIKKKEQVEDEEE
ncbi:MAG: PilN domain-containing protein [Nitrospirota bacterium]